MLAPGRNAGMNRLPHSDFVRAKARLTGAGMDARMAEAVMETVGAAASAAMSEDLERTEGRVSKSIAEIKGELKRSEARVDQRIKEVKGDIAGVRTEIAQLRTGLRDDIAGLRPAITDVGAGTRSTAVWTILLAIATGMFFAVITDTVNKMRSAAEGRVPHRSAPPS